MEPMLRTHVLALIATGTTPTRKSLIDFLSKTFYAFQYSDMFAIQQIVDKVLEMLNEYKFIQVSEKVNSTDPLFSPLRSNDSPLNSAAVKVPNNPNSIAFNKEDFPLPISP